MFSSLYSMIFNQSQTFKTYLCLFFCTFLLSQMSVAQNSSIFQEYTIGNVRLESPYPLRRLDFRVQIPQGWDLSFKKTSAHGFLSANAEYGVIFQARYEGMLPFDMEEFGSKLLAEVRRRLNLSVDYMTKESFTRSGYYGYHYTGKVNFRQEPTQFNAIIVADKDKIILLVITYPLLSKIAADRMESVVNSIDFTY